MPVPLRMPARGRPIQGAATRPGLGRLPPPAPGTNPRMAHGTTARRSRYRHSFCRAYRPLESARETGRKLDGKRLSPGALEAPRRRGRAPRRIPAMFMLAGAILAANVCFAAIASGDDASDVAGSYTI